MFEFIKSQKINLFFFILIGSIFYFLIESLNWKYFIGTSSEIFGDFKENLSWLNCNYLNFKVYEDNTCAFKTNYGPALFLIPYNEGLKIFYENYLPYILIYSFLLVSISINNPKRSFEMIVVFFLLINTSTFLLVERLNFDILIFLALIFVVYNKFYLFNWSIILFFGLAKIYPFILGLNIFLENKFRNFRNLLFIIMCLLIITLLYLFIYLDEYKHVLFSNPASAGLHMVFTIKSAPKIIKYLFDINYIFTLPIMLVLFYLFNRYLISNLINQNIGKYINLFSSKTNLFLLSGLIITICYVIFSNYIYREVFFILTIPLFFYILKMDDTKLVKLFLYLIIIKSIFSFFYGYFNVTESLYHVDNIRYYTNSFLVVSILKSILDFLAVSFISAFVFIILRKYFNHYIEKIS